MSKRSTCRRRVINGGVQNPVSSIKHLVSRIQYLAFSLYAIQTPIIRGERTDRLGDIKKIISTLLASNTFYFVVVSIGIVIVLLVMYNRGKTIPDLTAEVVKDDTWFVTRDDNNRVGIVVSIHLNNKATRGVHITNCRLSGYSAKEHPDEIYLKGPEDEQNLSFPEYKHFCRGQDYYLGPYSSETIWLYYESRSVTMRNVLNAPLTIRDSNKKRISIQVQIPRHDDQIAIYQEMAKMW